MANCHNLRLVVRRGHCASLAGLERVHSQAAAWWTLVEQSDFLYIPGSLLVLLLLVLHHASVVNRDDVKPLWSGLHAGFRLAIVSRRRANGVARVCNPIDTIRCNYICRSLKMQITETSDCHLIRNVCV